MPRDSQVSSTPGMRDGPPQSHQGMPSSALACHSLSKNDSSVASKPVRAESGNSNKDKRPVSVSLTDKDRKDYEELFGGPQPRTPSPNRENTSWFDGSRSPESPRMALDRALNEGDNDTLGRGVKPKIAQSTSASRGPKQAISTYSNAKAPTVQSTRG